MRNIRKYSFSLFQPGYYQYNIVATGTVDYILATITSKSKNVETLPIETKCWTSSNGYTDVDVQAEKLSIFAKIEQGTRPVLNAKVEYVMKSGKSKSSKNSKVSFL